LSKGHVKELASIPTLPWFSAFVSTLSAAVVSPLNPTFHAEYPITVAWRDRDAVPVMVGAAIFSFWLPFFLIPIFCDRARSQAVRGTWQVVVGCKRRGAHQRRRTVSTTWSGGPPRNFKSSSKLIGCVRVTGCRLGSKFAMLLLGLVEERTAEAAYETGRETR